MTAEERLERLEKELAGAKRRSRVMLLAALMTVAGMSLLGAGGEDTMRLVWTEPTSNGPYAIKFALSLHQNSRDGYYQVVCGQDTPSPYCVHRDGAVLLDSYPTDSAHSVLKYRLRYLNPLCSYRVHAIAYQNSASTAREELALWDSGVSTCSRDTAILPACTPVDVWLDIPPGLYRDGAVNFRVTRLQGQNAVLSGLTVYEHEGDTNGLGGEQSSGINPNLFPKELLLFQSYPNPATGVLTIRYGIPNLTNVSLKVYDISGKVVRTLETSNLLKPGYYNVTWNCRDDRNQEVAGGVYFYRLVANNSLQAAGDSPTARIKTRKLVIAR